MNKEKLSFPSATIISDSTPEWVNEMWRFYARTGGYRPEDIARVLGDCSSGVQFGASGLVEPIQKPPVDLEEAFEALRKAGGDGWDAIDDPVAYIKEMRGDETEETIGVSPARLVEAEARAAKAEQQVAEWRTWQSREDDEIMQSLGKAMDYPRFKDHLDIFPDATEEHGISPGEHVASTMASEAARYIVDLKARTAKAEGAVVTLCRVIDVVWKYCEERNARAAAYAAEGNKMASLVLTREEIIFNDLIKAVTGDVPPPSRDEEARLRDRVEKAEAERDALVEMELNGQATLDEDTGRIGIWLPRREQGYPGQLDDDPRRVHALGIAFYEFATFDQARAAVLLVASECAKP